MPDQDSNEPIQRDAIRIYCNLCKRVTHHKLAFTRPFDHRVDEDDNESEYGVARLWYCAGCDTCTLENCYTTDNMVSETEDNSFQQDWQSVFYPKRTLGGRSLKTFHKLPPKLALAYTETIRAFNDDSKLLCAAGLRILIEGICSDKGITGRRLQKKIDHMTQILPPEIVENLHGFRFMGNDAVHDLIIPGQLDLSMAIEVIEDILNFLYALNYKASILEWLRGKGTRIKKSTAPGTPPTGSPSSPTEG